MNAAQKPIRFSYLSIPLIVTVFSAVLVPRVALMYSYDTWSIAMSGVGCFLLLAASAFLWMYSRRTSRQGIHPDISRAITVGMALGLLWIAEIGINNLVAPPLPARDIIDNIFWAVIGLGILILATICAYRAQRIRTGILVGAWSGFVSGALACCMALSLIVFGMRFLLRDPLNVAEWAARGMNSRAPTMAAYRAYETFAGAFGHLTVLGVGMGLLLGMLGGVVGKAIPAAGRLISRPK